MSNVFFWPVERAVIVLLGRTVAEERAGFGSSKTCLSPQVIYY